MKKKKNRIFKILQQKRFENEKPEPKQMVEMKEIENNLFEKKK